MEFYDLNGFLIGVKMEIHLDIANALTDDEQVLFELLLEVQQLKAPSTVIRIAGGWVRDKIMGEQSHDIDIMLDNMSGEDFARLVTDYMGIDTVHVVQANPDASKHLETAGAFIPMPSGSVMDLDFARARKEVYNAPNSRNPEIKPATPEEDAFRRDLTIGTLFYNLHTKNVEDFTGKGINDLKNEIIRTPLDPLKTFSDDPLRIFRTIRFAARYGWSIEEQTKKALSDPSLRDDIKNKITKERMQEEIRKMFSESNPVLAAQLLKKNHLLQDIIEEALQGTVYEGKLAPLDMNQNNPHHNLNLWDHTMRVLEEISHMYPVATSGEEKRLVMTLSALLHDLGKLYYEVHVDKGDRTSYHGHEDESAKIAEAIMQYLKFSNDIAEQVKKMVSYHMRPHNFVEDNAITMKGLRRFLRIMGENSVEWLDVFNHALADAKSKGASTDIDAEMIRKYQELENKLNEALSSMKLTTPTSRVNPVLNGHQIMDTLGIKPGPQVGEAMKYLQDLQDEIPDITPEQAQQKLRKEFQQQRQASALATACPMHLIMQKRKEINNLIQNDNYFEAMSVIKKLKDEYGDDEDVMHLIAEKSFRCAVEDTSILGEDIVMYIFDKANDLYFDPYICCFAFGISLIKDTLSQPEAISKIGERMRNMAPKLFVKVLSDLKKKEVMYPEIYKRFAK